MPQTNVSSCVLSIITSFSSGLDVFKKFRDTRHGRTRKIKKAAKPPTEEEVRLVRSLRQGPEDIGREYQRSVQILGDNFAVGDSIAQTSLAEVLLKLNTGLVNIINTFLSRDSKNAQIDYQSLTVLSDKSRIDTCRTLRQLYRRMLQLCAPPVAPIPEHSGSEASKSKTSVRDAGKRKKNATTTTAGSTTTGKHTKVRAPILARVVVENSAKPSQIALVKPGERKKKTSRSNSSPRLPSASPPTLAIESASPSAPEPTLPELPVPISVSNPILPGTISAPTRTRPPPPPPPRRLPRAAYSTPQLTTLSTPPEHTLQRNPSSLPTRTPMPLVVPRPQARTREAIPTFYSIASGSTRLGEVPMHEWAEPYDFDAMSVLNREAARKGWPVGGEWGATAGETGGGKRKGSGNGNGNGRGIWRLFRRGEREV